MPAYHCVALDGFMKLAYWYNKGDTLLSYAVDYSTLLYQP